MEDVIKVSAISGMSRWKCISLIEAGHGQYPGHSNGLYCSDSSSLCCHMTHMCNTPQLPNPVLLALDGGSPRLPTRAPPVTSSYTRIFAHKPTSRPRPQGYHDFSLLHHGHCHLLGISADISFGNGGWLRHSQVGWRTSASPPPR